LKTATRKTDQLWELKEENTAPATISTHEFNTLREEKNKKKKTTLNDLPLSLQSFVPSSLRRHPMIRKTLGKANNLAITADQAHTPPSSSANREIQQPIKNFKINSKMEIKSQKLNN
jgi:hypothetical protein